jgi:hypothetical protein
MYAIGSSARRGFAGPTYDDELSFDNRAGFGVIPAVAVSAGVSLLGSLFGSHSGKTTHAERFIAAQNAGDQALARTLIDQAYSHAFLETIPDKADWQQVWQVMLNEANPANRAYMNQKMGIGSTSGAAVTGTPLSPAVPAPSGDFTRMLLSPVGIAAALAIFFAVRKR